MIIILMGAPGAGKGTQADFLVRSKGFKKIATGDILRRQIELGSAIGKQIEDIVNKGHLVSDDILLEVLRVSLREEAGKSIVLDGFPRTLGQAQWLSKQSDVAGVIHIDAEGEELVRRIEGRLICGTCHAVYHLREKPPRKEGICDRCASQLIVRKDDSRNKISVRLDTYENETAPVLNFYKELGKYFRVDGNRSTEQVSREIEALLGQLNFVTV